MPRPHEERLQELDIAPALCRPAARAPDPAAPELLDVHGDVGLASATL
jgi:hypothetical protein